MWQAAIRHDFRAGVLIKELYGKVYRHTATIKARADSEAMAGQAGVAVNLL